MFMLYCKKLHVLNCCSQRIERGQYQYQSYLFRLDSSYKRSSWTLTCHKKLLNDCRIKHPKTEMSCHCRYATITVVTCSYTAGVQQTAFHCQCMGNSLCERNILNGTWNNIDYFFFKFSSSTPPPLKNFWIRACILIRLLERSKKCCGHYSTIYHATLYISYWHVRNNLGEVLLFQINLPLWEHLVYKNI